MYSEASCHFISLYDHIITLRGEVRAYNTLGVFLWTVPNIPCALGQ